MIAYCRVVEVLHSGNRTAALETVGCVPVLHSSDWKTMGILLSGCSCLQNLQGKRALGGWLQRACVWDGQNALEIGFGRGCRIGWITHCSEVLRMQCSADWSSQ